LIHEYRAIYQAADVTVKGCKRLNLFNRSKEMRPPLLFVHGASCDARIWQHGFQQFFEQHGWHCVSMHLPGHGGHGFDLDLHGLGLDDYADELDRQAEELPAPPVIIGHSMGGYLGQRHVLEGRRAAGLVLLGSVPPQGMGWEFLHFMMHHPMLSLRMEVTAGIGGLEDRLMRARDMLMTHDTPEEILHKVADILQPESARALREMGLHALPRGQIRVPLMVAVGMKDQLIQAETGIEMARDYGVEAHQYADMAHMLQIEPGWDKVAADVLHFLQEHYLHPEL
jgi:pimeloyl-ACP methyl ester carboxylesterase